MRRSLAPDDARHGSENGYTNYRCHCDQCKAAHTAYTSVRKERHPEYDDRRKEMGVLTRAAGRIARLEIKRNSAAAELASIEAELAACIAQRDRIIADRAARNLPAHSVGRGGAFTHRYGRALRDGFGAALVAAITGCPQ